MLEDWTRALAKELGLDVQVPVRELLDIARVAAHSVDRPAAPLTTYLVGLAAAAGGGTPQAVAAAGATAKRLAQEWALREGQGEAAGGEGGAG